MSSSRFGAPCRAHRMPEAPPWAPSACRRRGRPAEMEARAAGDCRDARRRRRQREQEDREPARFGAPRRARRESEALFLGAEPKPRRRRGVLHKGAGAEKVTPGSFEARSGSVEVRGRMLHIERVEARGA